MYIMWLSNKYHQLWFTWNSTRITNVLKNSTEINILVTIPIKYVLDRIQKFDDVNSLKMHREYDRNILDDECKHEVLKSRGHLNWLFSVVVLSSCLTGFSCSFFCTMYCEPLLLPVYIILFSNTLAKLNFPFDFFPFKNSLNWRACEPIALTRRGYNTAN